MAKTGELDLPSGRRLYLREFRQYLTYEGLLEGLPTVERNKQRLEQLVADHRDKPYAGGPYLIRPTETPIQYNRNGKSYPFGIPSALPDVTCIGRFDSLQPARNETSDLSGLVVIWFQDEFAFPIDPPVVAQILSIDWEAHAADMDY
ncbi:hypothetical protein SAMN05444166_5308 [Singulisphaera sp. GP187]|uniref:hypothetical protein n=1 Tax=Singulisphaera sp. GP187 TaxID=1882752 RepID=UPI0009259B41|nr:hypothetical protein [Singulisphaera sp. GP187]SIO56877.1 hypothetical protein SAMN05444166_5308 [Singulisphaera sp. GP187]